MNQKRLAKLLEEAMGRIDLSEVIIDAVKDAVADMDFEAIVKEAFATVAQQILDEIDLKTPTT